MTPNGAGEEDLGLGSSMGSEPNPDSFTMDMTAPDPIYPVYPKGMYPMEIDTLEYKLSASKGNPMWAVKAKVTEECQNAEAVGSMHFINVTFTPAAIARVRKFLKAIGRDDLNQTKFKPNELADSGELIGAKFNGYLDYDMYQGRKKNKVKDVFPAGQTMASVKS